MLKKKILATLLICILLPQTTLFAKENTNFDTQERTIVSSKVYDTVTDREDLIELAVSQNNQNKSNNSLLSNLNTDSGLNTVSDIAATQIEAERIYSDGSIEKDIRVDGFIITDKNTNEVLTSSSYYDSYLPKSTSSFGVSAYHTAYFTIKESDRGYFTIQARYIVSSVNYSNVKVTNFVHGIFCEQDGFIEYAKQTVGVPSVNMNYYVYPTNTAWYPANLSFDYYTYMNVYLSNGTALYLDISLLAVINKTI